MTPTRRPLLSQFIPQRSNSVTDMKALFLLFILHTAFSDDFGTSYMKNGRLCREWACINTKLGLTDALPARDQYRQVLKGILPQAWHGAVEPALEGCYVNRTRRYTNTCPGQALLQCTVEKLIENCPIAYWRKSDACSHVSSLAGLKYMFSQGLYENFEANLAYEQRPPWFMKYYFNSKCCDLPQLFSEPVLTECGFTHVMHYHSHSPVHAVTQHTSKQLTETTTQSAGSDNSFQVHVVDLPPAPPVDGSSEDPLDCCDMTGFINPSWRSECDFRLKWDLQARLTIDDSIATTPVPTTTTTAKPRLDVKVLPLSCAQETCVFQKLNIITPTGVNLDAFSKMLNNLTIDHPSWSKAKARVVTKCLTRPITSYEADCEINKVLACTFDVLSENCPTAKKNDPCKHYSSRATNDIVCQISSANGLPKNRHQFCDIPRLITHDIVLRECGVSSISRLEYSTHAVPLLKRREPVAMCKKLTESTTCLLSKMGALNKYKFMDYFKMKANIRDFATTHTEWRALNDAYLSAFTSMPMYRDHCSSPKKLLNLLDSMLMTCPLSARKSSPKCNKMLNEISHSSIRNPNTTQEQMQQVLNQFQYIFLPPKSQQSVVRTHKVPKKMYNFGILDSGNVPPVKIIDVNPASRPIKVLLPVYQQIHTNFGPLAVHGHRDWVLRGGPGLP